MTLKVTDDMFRDYVLRSDKPVLVDFWAAWCGPCRIMSPILDEISNQLEDEVVIAKMNTDENPIMFEIYNVTSIPTLMLFKDGEIVAQRSGAASKAALLEWIDEHK
jgi:thioredoxin 1